MGNFAENLTLGKHVLPPPPSRCCCNETPSTAGRKLDFFTRTIHEISKLVCEKTLSGTRAFITRVCCMKRAHYSKRMLCEQDCVKFRGRIA